MIVCSVIILLFLLQLKHLYIDFYTQTMDQVRGKGIYGDWIGFTHSLEHAIITVLIVWLGLLFNIFPSGNHGFLIIVPLIDLVTHYHIDWMKMNWGNRDMMTEQFWNHLGLDQFAHQVVYLLITLILFAP